jgi:hypothetical protein
MADNFLGVLVSASRGIFVDLNVCQETCAHHLPMILKKNEPFGPICSAEPSRLGSRPYHKG